MTTIEANEPDDDWFDEEYVGERYCWSCGGRGWKITCPDDLCHGQDECIHGDPPTPCWECNRNGERRGRAPMTNRLTPEQKAKIRAREQAATAGPWAASHGDQRGDHVRFVVLGDSIYGPAIASLDEGWIKTDWEQADECDPNRAKTWAESVDADTRFIAHARTDIPALLNEIAALEAERDAEAGKVAQMRAALLASEPIVKDHPGVCAVWDMENRGCSCGATNANLRRQGMRSEALALPISEAERRAGEQGERGSNEHTRN